jgi:hypothetical protein
MPKFEVIHPEGNLLDNDIKDNLLKYFKNSDIQRLERLGGRISISITAPYTDKKKRIKKDIEIDDIFIKELLSYKDSIEDIKSILNKLRVKQLRKLSGLVGQPIRSNANAGET